MADSVTAPLPPPAPRTAPLAVWSLVLAILSFFGGLFVTAIPAVICGHVARSRVRKSGGALGGLGLATVGLIVGYIGLAVSAMGVPLLVDMIRADHERARRLAAERKEITSTDGRVRISIPGDWVELPYLSATARVRVGNRWKEQYLVVLSEAKSDFGNVPVEKYHQIMRDRILQYMTDSSGSAPVTVTIGGYPALQNELRGMKDGMDVAYLYAVVDTGDDYYQILAWTLQSRWDRNQGLLREVTRSFNREK
jgi:hypothetical protein